MKETVNLHHLKANYAVYCHNWITQSSPAAALVDQSRRSNEYFSQKPLIKSLYIQVQTPHTPKAFACQSFLS